MTDLRSAPVPPLREDDHLRGPDGGVGGPVVFFYGDFACPHCALAQSRLAAAPVRLVFRHFALKAKHPRTVPLARAAEAAALQGAFWPFHDSLYADQGRLADPHLWERARELGLDVERFDSDRRSDDVIARVERDVREAIRAGVAATPTLVVHGTLHPGVPSAAWVAALG